MCFGATRRFCFGRGLACAGAGTMNGKRLSIGGDLSAPELRRLARWEPNRAAAVRMQAIAGALEGMTRAEAARLAGMERQALRDAVLRYNAEGLAGLHDRPRPGSKPRLDEARRSALRQLILEGRRWRPRACPPGPWESSAGRWRRAEVSATMRAVCPSSGVPSVCHGRRPGPRTPKPIRQPGRPLQKGGCKANWTASRPNTQASA